MEGVLLEHHGRFYFTGTAKVEKTQDESWSYQDVSTPHPGFQWVSGKFVEADRANLNKQYWGSEDLEFGEFSVKHTPMNLLHQVYDPIGVFVDSKLVPAQDDSNMHIEVLGALWAYRYPTQAGLVEMADAAGCLAFSMECVGEALHCKNGCEEVFPYFTKVEDVCSHLRDRSSVRHIVNPTFTGGALILPPSNPAWPGAKASVLYDQTAEYAKQMDELAERKAENSELSVHQWRFLMSETLKFARR